MQTNISHKDYVDGKSRTSRFGLPKPPVRVVAVKDRESIKSDNSFSLALHNSLLTSINKGKVGKIAFFDRNKPHIRVGLAPLAGEIVNVTKKELGFDDNNPVYDDEDTDIGNNKRFRLHRSAAVTESIQFNREIDRRLETILSYSLSKGQPSATNHASNLTAAAAGITTIDKSINVVESSIGIGGSTGTTHHMNEAKSIKLWQEYSVQSIIKIKNGSQVRLGIG